MIGTFSIWKSFPIACIELVYYLHTLHDHSEWTKALFVQETVSLIPGVDEYLCCSRVRSRCCKDHCASTVGDLDRVIRNRVGSPFAHDARVSTNAELSNKTRKHSEESTVVVESLRNQILKDMTGKSKYEFELENAN